MHLKNIYSYTLSVCVILLLNTLANAMVMDNRYIPLIKRPWIPMYCVKSNLGIWPMIATANKSMNEKSTANRFNAARPLNDSIPEIYGIFDLGQLAEAVALTGQPNPLPTSFQGVSIPYNVEGKMQMQGISFAFEYAMKEWVALGATWLFMRVEGREVFEIDQTQLALSVADRVLLDDARRQIFNNLGLQGEQSSQVGFGDIDLYLRFKNEWEYTLKFRHIWADACVGMLAPTGVKRVVNEPTSIPFGGNGFWGLYFSAHALFEVREDMFGGVILRANKRFERKITERESVNGEPYVFGAAVNNFLVNPGWTLIFSPYVVLENLRDGLGLGLYYTLTHHEQDRWGFIGTFCPDAPPAQVQKVNELSEWGTDYFTVHVFYDFGKKHVIRDFTPILSLRWDIPALLYVSKQAYKTQQVLVGVEFAF